jgi:outer membrane protein OmpA-like peptidoglycan-associated protein
VAGWQSYKEVAFQPNRFELDASETNRLAEVATYAKANPTLEIGLDANVETGGNASDRERARELGQRRVQAIRESLTRAGVPAEKIKDGAFGDATRRADQRVEIFFRTAR